MKVIHSLKNKKIEKNTNENIFFIITNKKGGYCYLSNKPKSRYEGLFFNDNFKMYKVIENIKLDGEITEIQNNFYNIERKKNSVIEKYFMPYGFNSLVYELNKQCEFELILDIRESYKNPEFGRHYEMSEEYNKIIIKYNQENEFECYVVVSGYSSYNKTQQWFKQYYDLDEKRKSLPYEKHVFSALKLKSNKAVITFSKNKEKAIKENDYILNNLKSLKKKKKKDIDNLLTKNIKDINKKFAYYCALKQLNELCVTINKKEGIFAGLPWFFQFWARDELVSLKALLSMKKYYEAKQIILRSVSSIDKKGLIDRFPDGDILSADGIGWLLKRIRELNTESKKYLIKDNLKKIRKKIEPFVFYFLTKNSVGNLIVNHNKETWMDSIDRDGIKIEIQALWLSAFKTLYGITNDFNYKRYESKLKKSVRKHLWNGKYFADGFKDWTIRPNIFIANYIYPELLNKGEWVRCFERILPRLWLNYGGISTIDTESALFNKTHTGENNLSYHNGDSWFYLNNMAALVLYRTDKKIFKKYIDKIIKSSTEDILWKGAIGCASEISSASNLESLGCLSQAWSSATFIELIEEMY